MDKTTSTRQHLALSAPNLTLATKLFVPPITEGWVQRSRLLDRLKNGLSRKLTLISAPAGYGKTSLLSEWRAFTPETDRPPIAWLSLDEADNDWSRFLAHFVAALQTVETSIGQGALFSLQAPPTPTGHLQMTALINEIVALPYQFVLILDDYHTITASKIHDALTFLLDNLPPQLHIILATRTEPLLPLARLRANRALNEITAADLRFTFPEIASFLGQVLGLAFSPADIEHLAARTEGWIAAIQLIALSLQGKSDPISHIQKISGEHRHIADYFAQEVLAQQSPHIRDFLLQTAILDRFCAPLCQAVTANLSSTAIIKYLLENNLFLAPLDNEGTWFRYHNLFADHLRKQLTQTWGGDLHDLYHRASQWCNANGFQTEAISYALKSGDNDYAASLILGAGPQKLRQGELTTLLNWLDALSPSQLARNPRLSLLYAWTLEHTCVMDRVEPHLQNAEIALSNDNPTYSLDAKRAMQGEIAALRARIAVLDRNINQAITYSHEALALIPTEDLELRAAVTFQLALAYNVIDDIDSMQHALDDTITAAHATGDWRTLFFSAYYRAQIDYLRGHLRRALDFIRQIERWAAEAQAVELPAHGFILTAHAQFHYDMNQLDTSETMYLEALKLGERGGEFHILVRANIGFAYTKIAQHDHATAFAYLEKASTLTDGGPFYDVFRATIALQQGDLQRATHWFDILNLSVDTLIAKPQISYFYIPYIRFLIAQKRYPDAQRLLAVLTLWATDQQLLYYAMRYNLLLSIIEAASGNTTRALKTLEPILIWANAENCPRLFLDEPLATNLLQFAAQSHTLSPQIRRFIIGILDDLPETQLPFSPSPLPFDGLSSRELDLLPLLAAGLSNKAIAEELCLSAGTVKWHLKSIYRKLDVHSRTQAVATARDLNLIR